MAPVEAKTKKKREEKREESQEEEEPEKKEEKRRERKPKKKKSGGLISGSTENILCLIVGAGVCYYKGFHLPVMDAISAKLGLGWKPNTEAYKKIDSTMDDIRKEKAIDLHGFYSVLNHHCGIGLPVVGGLGGRCSDFLKEMPKVAASVKRGPGTWDRKKLKKAEAQAMDNLISTVASRNDAASARRYFKIVVAELLTSSPKSLKGELKAPGVLEQTTTTDEL
eukprot:TRINITY_DN13766_c3_g1_i1.p1 TRINITY_DN13766_c3_g1~~TRINITY_DN13766_c3_g1_i1.p1  ORF type:complete len:246 (+),score=69.54 TRINITY_DN13766_c3_g1_i1:70-738(+)